jgi:hypothetical protein
MSRVFSILNALYRFVHLGFSKLNVDIFYLFPEVVLVVFGLRVVFFNLLIRPFLLNLLLLPQISFFLVELFVFFTKEHLFKFRVILVFYDLFLALLF